MEQGYSTFKTPTCLLLNQREEFMKFGFEAAEKYAELEDARERSFYYFDDFKMMLYGLEVSWRILRIIVHAQFYLNCSSLIQRLSWAYGLFIFPS